MSTELSANQQRSIIVRMTGKTWVAVAAEVGVSERTLRRWGQEPAYKEGLESARTACREAALDLLVARSSDLAQVLVDVAMDTDASPSARVSAAREALSRIGIAEVQRHEHRELPSAEFEAMLQQAMAEMTDEELGVTR